MKTNTFRKIILVSSVLMIQGVTYGQSLSSLLLDKSTTGTVSKVSIPASNTAVVSATAAVIPQNVLSTAMLRSIPLTTEVLTNVQMTVQLADHPVLNRLSELIQSVEKEGMVKSWYLNDATIIKLNNLATNGTAEALNTEVISIGKKVAEDFFRGRVTSEMISDKAKITVKKLSQIQLDFLKKYALGELTTVELLESLRPKNMYYLKLVEILNHVMAAEAQNIFANAPAKLIAVKPGIKKTEVVIYARTLLNILGYKNNTANGLYDEELNLAIKAFQANQGLTVDGALGSQGWAWLNLKVDQLKTRLIINIDRARWLPDSLGSEHVFVNLAMQKLKLIQNDQTVLEFKTINGRVDRQTPMLLDRINHLILNPTWTVPTSILIKDKLPLFTVSPQKVSELNMKMIDDATDAEVDPLTFDWTFYSNQYELCKNEIATGLSKKRIFPDDCRINIPHTFVQQPGTHNALGLIKFPLANPYAIYLHDTDSRSKFNEAKRLLSSGCVRLQKPFEFAEKLLNNPEKWSLQQLHEATELLPEPALVSTRVGLGRSLPVYLYYFTTHVDDLGQLSFAQDAYGTDLLTLKLMNK